MNKNMRQKMENYSRISFLEKHVATKEDEVLFGDRKRNERSPKLSKKASKKTKKTE